jgi:hypothetical protein
MNNIGKMVKQYNRFIDDLGMMNKDISELFTNEFKLEYAAEYWSPRDRSAWSSKQRFNSWYKNKKIIFYSCIDLIADIPYLQLLKCDVNLKTCKIEEFSENDGFNHTDNSEIEKIENPEYIYFFEQDWGKCYYCKIDITSIVSNETINTDIKKLIKNLMDNDFSNLKFNSITLIKN